MSREYGIRESDGARVLLLIRCDGPNCEEEIKPHPQIASSGWIRMGTDHGPGTDKLEWDHCPRCAR